MNLSLDHVGWTTSNIEAFEAFWCDIVGYRRSHSSAASSEMLAALFGIVGTAEIRRYHHERMTPDIEIHCFSEGSQAASMVFHRDGLSHVCLMTGGPGSREQFLGGLPGWIEVRIFDNPKGWKNIFILDQEKNWVELRERLN